MTSARSTSSFAEKRVSICLLDYINLVLSAVGAAKRKEKVTGSSHLHSDQDFQYTSQAYCDPTKSYHITPSMSRRGRPLLQEQTHPTQNKWPLKYTVFNSYCPNVTFQTVPEQKIGISSPDLSLIISIIKLSHISADELPGSMMIFL